MRRSKELIEDRLGAACRHFAYPWGVGSPAADATAGASSRPPRSMAGGPTGGERSIPTDSDGRRSFAATGRPSSG